MNTIEGMNVIPIWAWIILAVGLLAQGTWVFNDASKRGMNKWVWGFLCLLNTPTNLIVYLIVSRSLLGFYKCPECYKKHSKTYKYCPYCGHQHTQA